MKEAIGRSDLQAVDTTDCGTKGMKRPPPETSRHE